MEITDFFEIPMLPKFIRLKRAKISFPVSQLTEKEARLMGKAWTEALVKKAKGLK